MCGEKIKIRNMGREREGGERGGEKQREAEEVEKGTFHISKRSIASVSCLAQKDLYFVHLYF